MTFLLSIWGAVVLWMCITVKGAVEEPGAFHWVHGLAYTGLITSACAAVAKLICLLGA